jgi:hypothetical protein
MAIPDSDNRPPKVWVLVCLERRRWDSGVCPGAERASRKCRGFAVDPTDKKVSESHNVKDSMTSNKL